MHWQTHTVLTNPHRFRTATFFSLIVPCVTRWPAKARSGIELLASIGQQLGTAESLELGRLANVNPPELLRYDPTGERLDDVRFHPARHLLMQGLCANRVHNRRGKRRRVKAPLSLAPRASCCMLRLRPERCAP